MSDDELIHPLRDVWLRPRRVFRELARAPLRPINFALAALQGIGSYLLLYRLDPAPGIAIPLLLSNAVLYGAVTGVVGIGLYAAIYAAIGERIGRVFTRGAAFHVLSYGSVPAVAALLVTAASALVISDAALLQKTAAEADGFVQVIARLQLILVFLLYVWGYLLQVMGLSELLAVPVRRAFRLWLLGQLLGFVAVILLDLLVTVFYQTVTSGG